jgi:hypothetical protein
MAERVEIRLNKLDRQVAAMQKLILTGMKMLVKNDRKHEQNFLRLEGAQFELRQQQIAMREELRLLAAEQRQTTKTLDRFIRSMERGSNGHA